jgi:bifunctional non-homologous end joining protein LigD
MVPPRDHQKRLFVQTTEPAESGLHNSEAEWRLFVVHKHDATRLHYDFRLEHAGVLKSWAVPRGPCLDPTQRRLAVLVNDHAIEYGGFEGTIPAGLYGAGTVLLWDGGRWRTDQDVDQALRAGELKFQLCGRKLNGSWSLSRTSWPGAKREEWLLMKENDTEAKPLSEMDILIVQPASVLTGRTLEEIASEPPLWTPAKSTRNAKSRKPAPNQLSRFPENLEP